MFAEHIFKFIEFVLIIYDFQEQPLITWKLLFNIK